MTIRFERGVPVSLNGKRATSAAGLLEELNKLGAEHGIGRIDLVENRFVGMKSRGCYETPGGTLIYAAHRELEALTLDRSTLHYKQKLALDYAEMVYNGLWFTPLREALDAFFEKASRAATRRSDAAAVQGQYRTGVAPVAEFALLARYRELHHGRKLRPEGRAGLHQPDRACRSRCGRCWRERREASERSMKLWGGRFEDGPSEVFERFSGSLAFRPAVDRCRYPRLAGLRARAGAGRDPDRARSARGLSQRFRRDSREDGAAGFFEGATDEDVHTLVIRKLKERAGAVADKIHTGRSRNEQVSLDTRLWLRDECDRVRGAAGRLMAALLDLAEALSGRGDSGLYAYAAARRRCCGRTICWRISRCSRAIGSGLRRGAAARQRDAAGLGRAGRQRLPVRPRGAWRGSWVSTPITAQHHGRFGGPRFRARFSLRGDA